MSADSPKPRDTSDFLCGTRLLFDWDKKKQKYIEFLEKYTGADFQHLLKECVKEDPKENTTCYMFVMQDYPSTSFVKG